MEATTDQVKGASDIMTPMESSSSLFTTIKENVSHINELMHTPKDLVARIITVGNSSHVCAIVSMDGLSDKKLINEQVINKIQQDYLIAQKESQKESENGSRKQSEKESPPSYDDVIAELMDRVLSIHSIQRANQWDKVMQALLSGNTVLFLEGMNEVLIIGSAKFPERSVEEPPTESLVRGPREGFTESIHTNKALIRMKINDPNLFFDNYSIGKRAKKDLAVCYINGVIHPDLVAEVKRRLDSLDIDDAPESGIIEQWIEDSFLSPFPQMLHTERPDKVSAALQQGKIAIFLDGTPFVLLLPTTLVSLIQSPEDYYERWMIGSLLRLLRYGAILLALFLPALYIALVSLHQGMIPFKLAFSIAASRQGVPFPAVIEALLMEVTLELLREAGIRLPRPIGQTIGIVGGLVIGDAAVQAGVVSPIMVIVVAVTAIASFANPSYSAGITFRMLRFATMMAASTLGLYGIILVYIMISLHLVRLKSFGIPYSTPFSPTFYQDWKDLFIRAPVTFMTTRPKFLQTVDEKRTSKKGNKT